jgi:hypothetical protein
MASPGAHVVGERSSWRLFDMRPFFRKSIFWILIFSLSICQAQQAPAQLDGHAKKIYTTLSAYPTGVFLHLRLRDRSEKHGELGKLLAASFELIDPKTLQAEEISYGEVRQIQNGSYIAGNASDSQGRHRGTVGFLIVLGVAVGVGVGMIAASRN